MAWYSEYVPHLRFLLLRGHYAEALNYVDLVHPPKQYANPSPFFRSPKGGPIGELMGIMNSATPTLKFLNPLELHEVRVAAGVGFCVGSTYRRGRFMDPEMPWPYAMSKDAATHNIVAAYLVQRLKDGVQDMRHRFTARISNSCDGPCEACKDAASRMYKLDNLPEIPLVRCTNMKQGCRCAVSLYDIRRPYRNTT